ncbi:unnamed protein product [Gadus morhua 'NCC']
MVGPDVWSQSPLVVPMPRTRCDPPCSGSKIPVTWRSRLLPAGRLKCFSSVRPVASGPPRLPHNFSSRVLWGRVFPDELHSPTTADMEMFVLVPIPLTFKS